MKKEIFKPEIHGKGWGHEEWIANSEKYCGKMLFMKKGKKFSVHYHHLKDETFFLESGKVKVLLADSEEDYHKGRTQEMVMNPGDCLYLWPGRVHQVSAFEDSRIFEFSTQHFEDDSKRIVRGD